MPNIESQPQSDFEKRPQGPVTFDYLTIRLSGYPLLLLQSY